MIYLTTGPVLQGTRSAPREIILENAILPKDPGTVRVLTPPRMITMNEHHFPTAIDDPPSNEGSEAYGPSSIESNEERHLVERPKNLYNTTMNDTTLMNTRYIIIHNLYLEDTENFFFLQQRCYSNWR